MPIKQLSIQLKLNITSYNPFLSYNFTLFLSQSIHNLFLILFLLQFYFSRAKRVCVESNFFIKIIKEGLQKLDAYKN